VSLSLPFRQAAKNLLAQSPKGERNQNDPNCCNAVFSHFSSIGIPLAMHEVWPDETVDGGF
jgi:hypothetical protein